MDDAIQQWTITQQKSKKLCYLEIYFLDNLLDIIVFNESDKYFHKLIL